MSKSTLTVNGEPWLDSDFAKTDIYGQFHQRKVVGPDEILDVWATMRDGELVIAATSTRGAKPGAFVGPETRTIRVSSEQFAFDKEITDDDVWPGCFATLRVGSLGLIPDDDEHARHWEWNGWYLDDLPEEIPDHVREELAKDIQNEGGRNYIDKNPKASQQGSPRHVWADFLPCVAAKYGIDFDYTRLEAWTDRQGAWRALHWIADPKEFEYEEVPYQRKVEVDGKDIPCFAFHRQHFEMTKALAHHILTGDPVAGYTARKHLDALSSQAHFGKFKTEENLRGIGWPLEALALGYAWTRNEIDAVTAEVLIDTSLKIDPQWYPVPWIVVNKKARERNDHAYMGISTWMHARIGFAFHRWATIDDSWDSAEICGANLDYARMVSQKGPGTFPDDFDEGSKVHHIEGSSGYGSGSTTMTPPLLYWMMGNEHRQDRKDYAAEFFNRADCCRVKDKNAKWPLILRIGSEVGYR